MSFPRYPTYKDSTAEWITCLPSHWDVTRLKRRVDSTNAGEVIDKSHWGGEDELLYTCAIEPMRSDFHGFPDWKRTTTHDLLLTRNGTPYIHKPVENSIYTNVVQRIILANPLERDFLALAAQSAANNLQGYGVSIESLNYGMWSELLIPAPPLEEALSITSFLDRETTKIDALIAEQQRLIELLQEKRQAVISNAVTRGLNPNVPMKESGVEWLGEIPEHWEVKPLKRLASIDNSGCYGEEEGLSDIDMPVATTAQIDANGDFIVEKMSVRSFTLEEAARYSCNPRDILVVKSSGSATNIISGKAGLVSDDTGQFVFSNFLLRVRPLPEHSARYVYFLLRSGLTRSRVEKMCSTTTYPNLQVGIYCSANLPVPPLKEQREIAEHIGQWLQEIDSLVNQAGALIALIEERRSALISAAVTGQIDVRGLVPEAAEQ